MSSSVGDVCSSKNKLAVRPGLFCFSHLRWAFVWQRPQHLLIRAARDYDVYFFEEPILKPVAKAQLEIQVVAEAIVVLVPILPESSTPSDIVRLQEQLIAEYLAEQRPSRRVFWYYTPNALAFTRNLQREATIYDNMDELSAFRGAGPELLRLEAELFACADLVFTGGLSLYEAKRDRHDNIYCFPSSIDAAHFTSARLKLQPDPADQRFIPHPRIGFFGVVDERMDLALVAAMADRQPEWHFVLIGPVVKISVADLPRRDNLHWLGMRSYNQLPGYLARWDVGLMPFELNESTRFISPTKTPEFLAAGLPVVCTPIPDVIRTYGRAGLVEIARDVDGAIEAIEKLMHAPRVGWLAEVDARLGTESWDATWAAMDELIGQIHGPPVPQRGRTEALQKV